MFANFDFDAIWRALPYLFGTGMVFTLQITALGALGGILLGIALALGRLSRLRPLALAAGCYVNFMRSIPLVMTIFWFYFLVPWLIGWAAGSTRPISLDPFWTAIIAFIVFEAAYYGEIIRGGIQAVAPGQVNAALALGMTRRQATAHVVLPQALRMMVPVLLTQTIQLFQDVSLVYVLSMTDFVGAAAKIAERDARLPEMYLFVALVYFLASFGLSRLARGLQRRLALER